MRDLSLGLMLVLIGLGLYWVVFNCRRELWGLFNSDLALLVIWIVAPGVVVAGVLTPFKRPWSGLLGAICVQIAIYIVHLADLF
jgi:hypothetical protein